MGIIKPKRDVTTAKEEEKREEITISQPEIGVILRDRLQAREFARDQGTIGFIIAPDWLRGWHEFPRLKGKPIHSISDSL